MEYHNGDCDQCGTEKLLVHTSTSHEFEGGRTVQVKLELCEVCMSMIYLNEPMSHNLAVCTNMILRELRLITGLLQAATQEGP